MFFWHFFVGKPFAALSIIICLATIYSCISLKRGYVTHIADRFLIGLIGLLAVYQGLRVVHGVGLLTLPMNSTLSDLVDLAVATLFFQAPMMLRMSCNDRLTTDFELRLAKAAPPKGPLSLQVPTSVELRDRAMAMLEMAAWAVPNLADAAFRLYVYLWLRSDPATKRTILDGEDVLRHLGRTIEELERPLNELQKKGACLVRRERSAIEIEMLYREPNKVSATPPATQTQSFASSGTEALRM